MQQAEDSQNHSYRIFSVFAYTYETCFLTFTNKVTVITDVVSQVTYIQPNTSSIILYPI